MPDFPYPKARDWVNKSEGWVAGDPVADAKWFEDAEAAIHQGQDHEKAWPLSGTPTDGQIVAWDASANGGSGAWVPGAVPATGVQITGDPADGQFFAWDEASGTLVPVAAPSGGGGTSLPVTLVTIGAGAADMTWNHDGVYAEFLGSARHRFRADLSDVSEVRLTAMMIAGGHWSGQLHLEYSVDDGTTWSDTSAADGSAISVPTDSAGFKSGAWTPVAAGAKGDVLLRLMGFSGGNEQAPVFGNVQVQARAL